MWHASDDRVRELVDMVKYWSKRRYIGDASKGSLNSFGHTLMVIHFAQNCEPPLVPNLQRNPVQNHPNLNTNPFIDTSEFQDFKVYVMEMEMGCRGGGDGGDGCDCHGVSMERRWGWLW